MHTTKPISMSIIQLAEQPAHYKIMQLHCSGCSCTVAYSGVMNAHCVQSRTHNLQSANIFLFFMHACFGSSSIVEIQFINAVLSQTSFSVKDISLV